MMKAHLRYLGLLFCLLLLLLAPTVAAQAAEPCFSSPNAYTDVAATPANAAIYRVSMLGLMQGAGGAFRPEDTMTRAEFAVVACRLYGIKEDTLNVYAALPVPFVDVAEGSWYRRYANACWDLGLVRGTNGYFLPGATVTQQEVVTVVLRALGYSELSGLWPENYLAKAEEIGLTQELGSSAAASRRQVAELLNAALDLPMVYRVQDTAAQVLLADKGIYPDADDYVQTVYTLLNIRFAARSEKVCFADPPLFYKDGVEMAYYISNETKQVAKLAASYCLLSDNNCISGRRAELTFNAANEILCIEILSE